MAASSSIKRVKASDRQLAQFIKITTNAPSRDRSVNNTDARRTRCGISGGDVVNRGGVDGRW